MRNKNFKLVAAIVGIFITMPLNGYLYTTQPAWFPTVLIIMQVPMIASVLRAWYKSTDSTGENPVNYNNLPGHRTPPPSPRRRRGLNEYDEL